MLGWRNIFLSVSIILLHEQLHVPVTGPTVELPNDSAGNCNIRWSQQESSAYKIPGSVQRRRLLLSLEQ